MKKPTQRDLVRAHLIEHGSITNVEAVQMRILRLSERIRELEADGFSIRGDWVREGGKRTGMYKYVLVVQPSPPPRYVYVEEVREGGERVRVRKLAA